MNEIEQLKEQARKSHDWLVRRRAIIQLSHEKDESLYPLFYDALSDPVSEVRHAAIIALTRFGDKSIVPELAKPKFLQSDDPNIRWMTVKALGQLGDYHVIDLLIPLVDDEEWLVRNEAISVLQDKVQCIVNLGEPSLARMLILMLGIDEPGIVDIAVEGLVDMENSTRPLLLEALNSIKDLVRQNVARVLGLSKDSEAVPALIDALRDDSAAVRAEVAKALGNIGDRHAIAHLIESLKDHNDMVREATVQALVKFGNQCVESLHSELSHTKNKYVIAAIISALGELQAPSSIPILIEHLSSTFYSVRKEAVDALSRYGEIVVEPLLQKLVYNTSDIEPLIQTATSDPDINNRIRAIKALGDLEDSRATPLLKALVINPNRMIAEVAEESLVKVGCSAWGRSRALTVIGNVAHSPVAPELIPSLKDNSPYVRYEAIRAIGKLKGKKAIPMLRKMAMEDPIVEIRTEALKVLRELHSGTQALLKLALKAVEDEAAVVRLEAVRILGDFANGQVLQPLIERLADPFWSVRISAENAICNYGKKVTPLLIDLLKKGHVESRCRIISAFARIGDERAIEPLEALLAAQEESPRIKAIAREALMVLKGETGRQAVNVTIPLC